MTLRGAIIAQLRAGPQHLIRIADAMRIPHAMAAEELHRMEDDGQVIQHETGLYQLSEWLQRMEQQAARK